MIDLPTSQQWIKLFDISQKIRKLEPWKDYLQAEIFTIKDKNEEEPVFCSILGDKKEFYGISVFKGFKALNGLFKIIQAGKNPPFYTIVENQQCVTLYFGEKDILGPGDYSAMELGKYQPSQGLLQHIFFRTYSPGLAPWYIDNREVNLLITSLNALYLGFLDIEKNKLQPNFKQGQSPTISNDTGDWVVKIEPLPHFEIEEEAIKIHDEIFLAKLKRLPRSSQSMEIDATFLTSPVSGKNSPRPVFPRICVIANHDEGSVNRQQVLSEDENHMEVLIHLFTEAMREKGRPRLLILRKDSIYSQIKDLCEKINVPIEERRSLEIIDDFLKMVGSYYPES